MKKLFFLIVLILYSALNINYTSIDKNQLMHADINVEIRDQEHKLVKVKKGTTINQLKKLYNLDLNGHNYPLNYVLSNNDIINLRNDKLSINKITLKQLNEIPYISQKLAQAIIDYRNENGLFKDFEELLKVKGLGTNKLKILKQYLVI